MTFLRTMDDSPATKLPQLTPEPKVVRISYREAMANFCSKYDEFRSHHQLNQPVSGESVSGAFFDIDGLIGPAMDTPAPVHEQARPMKGSLSDLSMLHFVLRSSLVLGEQADGDVVKEWARFSESCATSAAQMLARGGLLKNPSWVTDLHSLLHQKMPQFRARLDNIQLVTELRTQLYAYSFPESRLISISALAKDHLRTVNLFLLTTIHKILAPQTRELGLVMGERLIDPLLTCLFSLYFPNVNYSVLPVPRVVAADVLMRAKEVARVQVEFMVAHEFGHALLHEGRAPTAEMEEEADEFALTLLFDHLYEAEPDLPFTAIRWLFLYLTLDRLIGAELAGYPCDWVDVPIRERDVRMLKWLSPEKVRSSLTIQGSMGDCLLFEAKGQLKERGIEALRQSADEFEQRFCFPQRRP